MILHPLFHWSPTARRAGIQRRGLTPNNRPTCTSARLGEVCLSTSPSMAWMLSAAVHGQRGETWDCWQVSLDPEDAVEVMPFYGNRPAEVRVAGRIPKGRVWLIGTRNVPERGRRW